MSLSCGRKLTKARSASCCPTPSGPRNSSKALPTGPPIGPGSAADFHDRSKWTPGRRIRFSAGWGTLLTNDFRGCDPTGESGFDPISLISKVSSVEGRPAVKLSDNYAKALGPPSEIERYRRVFGTVGVSNIPVIA